MNRAMRIFGRSAVSDFLGDNIVYRNLVPVDPRIPGLPNLWEQINLPSSRVPRKTTLDYARVVASILEHIAEHGNQKRKIKRVIFIGDTHLNDGTAFQNICRAGGWGGMAFIAAEKEEAYRLDVEEGRPGIIVISNRWSALDEFGEICIQRDFRINDQTVVLLDLDKTILGARGRNDAVIDRARVEAANQTIRGFLGEKFDQSAYSTAYQRLNQPEFHPFTADNQDYLVYICMILQSELTSLEVLIEDVQEKRIGTFDQFLRFTESNRTKLPAQIRRVHDEVIGLVDEGDPTPFKDFRRQEFKQTVSRMGHLPENTPISQLLEEEITLTQEVRGAAITWQNQGALLFGLSDKPDEASIPSTELASQGYAPIHHVKTDVIGASP